MSEFGVISNESKIFYACVRQGYEVLSKIQDFKNFSLGELFPAVDAQWDNIKSILELGVSKKIAWTGMSMTKSDNVPDDTRIPPSAEINSNTIRIMHAKATALGVTRSANYEFFDPDMNFMEAIATWQQAVNSYLEIINMSQELGLFKIAAGELDGISDLPRGVAQLLMFDACEAPLANGSSWCSPWSVIGIREGFGDFLEDFFLKTPYELMAQALPLLDVIQHEQTASKVADPDFPDTKTIYEFSFENVTPVTHSAIKYSMAGLIRGVGSDGQHLTAAKYPAPKEGVLTLSKPLADAPATVTARLFGLRMI